MFEKKYKIYADGNEIGVLSEEQPLNPSYIKDKNEPIRRIVAEIHIEVFEDIARKNVISILEEAIGELKS